MTFEEIVSIHAPRVGRDASSPTVYRSSSVSIHAPRVGRDPRRYWTGEGAYVFQSTRPVWGATAKEVTTSLFCHIFMGITRHKYDFLDV